MNFLSLVQGAIIALATAINPAPSLPAAQVIHIQDTMEQLTATMMEKP